ncbi:hypothetical protein BN988_02864 [Oceanobacillus picturae]|uniref:Uncharacterized protein n=1 Tax=Oceanobacillus picturae TaxID=171693 RepID=W9BDD5_9BACI|nr:hypothetical protein [Oceanobacillus picturae]CDO04310.1 hypothetical protein BN988_02864 [Oceanobacillus picturae]
MRLISSRELTKEELLANLSTFLEKWISTSSKILIEEMELSFVVEGVKYDLSNNDEEIVFNLDSELDANINEISNMKKREREVISEPSLNYREINKWMFIKTSNLNIPHEIEVELDYVGNTVDLSGYSEKESLPVYSIERYCVKRKLEFLKKWNEQFIPKSILVSSFPLNSIENIPTSAIYFSDNEFHNCVRLSDVENVLDTKIYTDLKDKTSLVTTESIKKKLSIHLKPVEPVGRLFRWGSWAYVDNYRLENVFDINLAMKENGYCIVNNNEYYEKRFVDYLSEYDLNYFPKELKLKEKAVIYGVRIEDSVFEKKIHQIYKIDQILSKFTTLIHEKDLNDKHFRCPLALLHKLKREFSSQEKREDYNKLSPTGFTTKNELIFDSIPSNIQEIMNLHILEYKEKEKIDEIKKTKAKLK